MARKQLNLQEFNQLVGSRASLDLLKPVHIRDTTLTDIVKLDDGQRSGGVHIREIHFHNCIFKGKVVNGNYRQSGKLVFDQCIFENSANFGEVALIAFEAKNIFLEDLYVISERDIFLENINVSKVLTAVVRDGNSYLFAGINEGEQIIAQQLHIGANANELEIKNSSFKHVILTNVHLNNKAHFEGVKVTDLHFNSAHLQAVAQIADSIIDKLVLKNIRGDQREIMIEKQCKVNAFEVALEDIDKLVVSNCEIGNIKLTGTNAPDNVVDFSNVDFNELRFDNVINKGTITLRQLELKPKGLISFLSSNMGKTDFILCDFSKGQLEFGNSKITEVFLSHSEFPRTMLKEGSINSSQAQLAFGQLATAFQKQGDTVRALDYQSREIEAHYKTLRWTSHFFDLLNLSLNGLSNRFGRSWSRGIVFTFSCGLLFFCLMLISTDEYQWGVSFDPKFLPPFLKFMNPLRSIETEKIFAENSSIHLNSWSYAWDFLGRILLTYGYYQTIQAFRRFGRK